MTVIGVSSFRGFGGWCNIVGYPLALLHISFCMLDNEMKGFSSLVGPVGQGLCRRRQLWIGSTGVGGKAVSEEVVCWGLRTLR